MMQFGEIGLKWPVITQEDEDAVLRALHSGHLAGEGPEARQLEAEWAAYLGVDYCRAMNGGTSALHTALKAVGVKHGDKVATSAFSYAATFQAILACGAEPVFVDIDSHSFNIDLSKLADVLEGEEIAAIVPVHIHGMPVRMDRLMVIAGGIPIVEDACQAHGSLYDGQACGTFGVAGAFSLNHTKMLPAGEGGLLVTDDPDIDAYARSFRYTGEDLDVEPILGSRPYMVRQEGLNYLMPEMTAALARSQLTRLDENINRARSNVNMLRVAMGHLPAYRLQYEAQEMRSCWHKVRVYCTDTKADVHQLVEDLQRSGVPAAIWEVKPLPMDPIFDGAYDPDEYVNTQDVLDSSFLLGSERHPIQLAEPGEVREWAKLLESMG